MKKHLRYFMVCFVMIMTLLALIACENESNEGTTEGDTTPPASHVCEGNEWVVTVEPTCIAAGKRQKICECGEVIEVEDISALGHTAGDGATCTSPQLCTVCRTVLVNALGHRAGASATCVSAQVCTVCNTELAITYAHTPGAPATCTTAQICELCGAKLVEALGHTAGPEATCTSSQNCTVCEAELVPPIGHDASEKASCTSPQVCNRCDSVLEEPHGHIEGEPVIDGVVEPTCISYGSWYETVYCTECDEMLLHYWRKGDYAEHNVVDHYCTECGNMICSEGLEIEYSGSGYYVKGLGTCTDEDVYIGYYKNAPVSRVNLLDSACEKNVKNIYIDVQSLYIDNIYIPSLETLSVDAKIVLRTDVFIGCKRLKSLTLGPKVEGYRAFSDIGFELIEIINHSTSELGLSSGHALEIHDGPSRLVNQDGFLFYTYESTNYLVGYNGDGDIVLPESYNGESYAIYDCAFYGNDDIVELTIPDAVTEIGSHSFAQCYYLQRVILGETIVNIYDDAFLDCRKLEFNVLDNAKYIGSASNPYMYLYGAVDKRMAFPVHHDVQMMHPQALQQLEMSYTEYKGCHYLGDDVNPYVVLAYALNKEDVTICEIHPDTRFINDWAFYGCKSLESVVMPGSLTYIGYSAFGECESLKEINMPDGVHTIGAYAFMSCKGLERISIPDSVRRIGAYAFYGCRALEEFKWPSGTKKIEHVVLAECENLKSVIIPEGVTHIADQPFTGCDGIMTLTLPESITTLDKSAFAGTNSLVELINRSSLDIPADAYGLTALEVHDGESKLCKYGDFIFYACENGESYLIKYVGSSSQVVLPDSYNGGDYKIYRYAFYHNDVTCEITIPDCVTAIGDYAFSSNTNITKIIIPDSVTSIGNGAFLSCTSLEHVVLPSGIDKIAEQVFYGCISLKTVEIPQSVTAIEIGAFSYCSKLEGIVIPDGVIYIDYGAFQGCRSLQSIIIPDSVTELGKSAFEGCSSLLYVIMSEAMLDIGDRAFYECSSLAEVVMNETTTNIGKEAFYGCAALTEFIIPEGLYSIADKAFYGCSSLTSIIIPDSVEKMGEDVFMETGLENIYCVSAGRPVRWEYDWNGSAATVVWGYTGE